jgi:hypothetical protein
MNCDAHSLLVSHTFHTCQALGTSNIPMVTVQTTGNGTAAALVISAPNSTEMQQVSCTYTL